MSLLRKFRSIAIATCALAATVPLAVLGAPSVGAETASVPVNVTASPTVGLTDGQTVTVDVTAGSSVIYGVTARQCVSTASIDFAGDFNPTSGGHCTATPLSAGSDSVTSVVAIAPYTSASLTFRVGQGTETYNVQGGGTATVQCDLTHACKLVLLLQVENATVFQSFPIAWVGQGAEFNPVTPVRALDTRIGTGAPLAPIGQAQSIDLQVTGANGIPGDATAVVMNVTAVSPTAPGFVTVWPTGVTRPLTSSLNFMPGDVVPNLVTVGIGSSGRVSLFNNGGSVDLVADIVGYYSPVGGGYFTAVTPVRALDTRSGTGAAQARVAQGGEVSLQVTGANGIPGNATAVVMNVTAVSPTVAGYATVYPNGVTRPLASNLNYVPGDIVPNLVKVGIGTSGRVNLYNANGSVDFVADIVGYFSPDNTQAQFFPVTPVRALDTRNGTGAPLAKVGNGGSIDVAIRNANGIPNDALAVVMNTTAVSPSLPGFVTVWPTGVTRPLASNLNFVPGDVVPNLVAVGIGAGGGVSLFNNAGTVDLIADLTGYFA